VSDRNRVLSLPLLKFLGLALHFMDCVLNLVDVRCQLALRTLCLRKEIILPTLHEALHLFVLVQDHLMGLFKLLKVLFLRFGLQPQLFIISLLRLNSFLHGVKRYLKVKRSLINLPLNMV
jgi:hypothetical protein